MYAHAPAATPRYPLLRALGLLVIGALVEVGLVRTAGPPGAQLETLRQVTDPGADPIAPLLAALALAAELLAGYLLLVVALRVLAWLPGAPGRLAARWTDLVTLPFVKRGLDAILGGMLLVQVMAAPMAAHASESPPGERGPAGWAPVAGATVASAQLGMVGAGLEPPSTPHLRPERFPPPRTQEAAARLASSAAASPVLGAQLSGAQLGAAAAGAAAPTAEQPTAPMAAGAELGREGAASAADAWAWTPAPQPAWRDVPPTTVPERGATTLPASYASRPGDGGLAGAQLGALSAGVSVPDAGIPTSPAGGQDAANREGRPATAAARGSTYTVQPGDTLWDIAAAHLPEDQRSAANINQYWRQIYAENRQVLGEDPNLIHPGDELRIPPFQR